MSSLTIQDLFPSVQANPEEKKYLLVASTGGHLEQLYRLSKSLGIFDNATWLTFESPQSKSLLADSDVVYLDYIAPRDWLGVLKAIRSLGILDPRDYHGVISTGAAVSIAGFVWAKQHRKPSVYIESVSRTNGPSLSGKLTSMFKLASTFTQHEAWASSRWRLIPSVMSSFEKQSGQESEIDQDKPLRLFVTLGTIKPYRFDSLVDRIADIVGSNDEVVWQLGDTLRDDIKGETYSILDSKEFDRLVDSADVVVTHAGVGTILNLLGKGISPVIVPRLKSRSEHVDDHQMQIWELMKQTDTGIPVQVDDLDREVLLAASMSKTIMV